MDSLIIKAIQLIGDPFLIILLVIIWMLFKMLMKRDDLLEKLTNEVHINGKSLASITALINVLVYGKGRHGSDI